MTKTKTETGTTVRRRTRAASRRALDIVTDGTMEVTRVGYGNVPEEVERVRVPKFAGEVARVRVEGSVTRNMGDYNSIRVAVMVEMPCYPSEAEVDRCYDWTSAKVEQKIQDELSIAVGPSEGTGGA